MRVTTKREKVKNKMAFVFAMLDGRVFPSSFLPGQSVKDMKDVAKCLFGIDSHRCVRLISVDTGKEFFNNDEFFVTKNEIVTVFVEEGVDMHRWQKPSQCYDVKTHEISSVQLHKSQPKIMVLELDKERKMKVNVYTIVDDSLGFDCSLYSENENTKLVSLAVSSKHVAIIQKTSMMLLGWKIDVDIFNVTHQTSSEWNLERNISVSFKETMEVDLINCFFSEDGETIILVFSFMKANFTIKTIIQAFVVSTGILKYSITINEKRLRNYLFVYAWEQRVYCSVSNLMAFVRLNGTIELYDMTTGDLSISYDLSIDMGDNGAALHQSLHFNAEKAEMICVSENKNLFTWNICIAGIVFREKFEFPEHQFVRRQKNNSGCFLVVNEQSQQSEIWYQRERIVVFPTTDEECLNIIMSDDKKSAVFIMIKAGFELFIRYCLL